MVEIREITSKRGLKKFIDYPASLYKNNPNWVPPLFFDELNTLRKDKNPAFEVCEAVYFMAYKNNKAVGRIGAILQKKVNEQWKTKQVHFTRIDFIDDYEVSSALIKRVEKWAEDKGMTEVCGPIGFTDLDYEGMLVEGFDELGTFATIYNYPYYPKHIEKLGYVKEVDWIEFLITVPDKPNEKVARLTKLVKKRYGFELLHITRKKDFMPWAVKVFDLLQDAYKELYGFTTLSKEQVDDYIKMYFGFVNPDFVKIVVDKEGQLAGFGISFPSLSKASQKSGGKLFPFGFIHLLKAIRKNDRLDLYLVAVRPDLQGKGVNAILMDSVTRSANDYGITFAESNPELESNNMVQTQWKFYETRQHKRRRCFVKTI